MRLSSRPAFWLAASTIYTIATFALSSLVSGGYISLLKYRIDLLLHAVEYGILAYLIIRYYQAQGYLGKNMTLIWTAALISALVGGLNELWQTQVPGRNGNFTDAAANLIGAVIATSLFRWRNAKAR